MTTNKELTINDEPAWLAEVEGTPLAMAGTEEAGADDLALPTINVLQTLSPICDKTKPQYVEGMEAGMMYNTVTGEAYADGILFCPCYFRTEFSVFASRDAGGGFSVRIRRKTRHNKRSTSLHRSKKRCPKRSRLCELPRIMGCYSMTIMPLTRR